LPLPLGELASRILTPVPLPTFPAIYIHFAICQGTAYEGDTSEEVVRLSSSRIRSQRAAAIAALAAVALTCGGSPFAARVKQAQADAADDPVATALCPIVYPDDQTPGGRGYHYTFFGNAFFINDEGYLLTVAHVLETFRDGGQPYILVNRPNSPPKLMQVTVIAKDLQHDVAILHATTNPFAGKYSVTFLSLAAGPIVRGQSVLALSLHPQRIQDAHSFDSEREDSSPGTVLSYESTQLEKSAPAANVFLLSHPVVKGQSGSPVMDADSRAVVGLLEGLWLRGTPVALSKSGAQSNSTPGAAIPIEYALSLLKEHTISWRSLPTSPTSAPPLAPSSSRPH
jgi:trypsin-like peptidase